MNPILLAEGTELMWTVTISGIGIVFAVLLLLVGVFYLFGSVMKRTGGKKHNSQKAVNSKPKTKKEQPKQAAFTPKQPPAIQVVEDGVPLEVVAAITAAIAETEGGRSYTIRSIRRQQPAGSRPAWAMAGIADNTRPF